MSESNHFQKRERKKGRVETDSETRKKENTFRKPSSIKLMRETMIDEKGTQEFSSKPISAQNTFTLLSRSLALASLLK